MASPPTPKPPKPPTSLGRSGRDLWRRVVSVYELEDHEKSLLEQAAACLDAIDELRKVLAEEGYVSKGAAGQRTVHPAAQEIRMTRLAYTRIISALGFRDDDDNQTALSGHQVRSRAGHAARWGTQRGRV